MALKIKAWQVFSVAALAWSVAAQAADTLTGTITKTADDGKDLVIKTMDGKETAFNVSSKRTKLTGVEDKADIKVGQMVTVTVDGGEATSLSANAK